MPFCKRLKIMRILEGKEKKHIAVIKSLEEKIEKLKREISPKSNCNLGTQTS
jgi:hypothetical protein